MNVYKCYYCPETIAVKLRPYGPQGAMVCFNCAMSTTERKQQTETMFSLQLEASDIMTIDGSEVGPVPFNSVRQ